MSANTGELLFRIPTIPSLKYRVSEKEKWNGTKKWILFRHKVLWMFMPSNMSV